MWSNIAKVSLLWSVGYEYIWLTSYSMPGTFAKVSCKRSFWLGWLHLVARPISSEPFSTDLGSVGWVCLHTRTSDWCHLCNEIYSNDLVLQELPMLRKFLLPSLWRCWSSLNQHCPAAPLQMFTGSSSLNVWACGGTRFFFASVAVFQSRASEGFHQHRSIYVGGVHCWARYG